MSKIKVLHIIKTLNLGGAETNLLNLLAATDKDKYEMHVAYSFGGELEESFIKAGARLFKYSGRNHTVKSPATIAIVSRIARYLLKNRIDIVHTHNFSGHVWGLLAAKLAGKKVIEHVHDFRYLDPDDFVRRRGLNNQYKYIRLFKNASDRVIVLTKQNADYLVTQDLYPARKVVELQNGIPLGHLAADRDEQARTRARLNVPRDAQVVLTPVRVAPEKNVDLILRIAQTVYRRRPGVVFVIAGEGPLIRDFQKQADENYLTKFVRFVGFHADIRSLLAISDIMLLPSFLELHSIAILEAMSMKVPVVVSSGVGCNSEFIKNGENGILLDPFSDAGWAESVLALLDDKDFRAQIGEAGFDTCREMFDISRTSRMISEIYDSTLPSRH